MSNIASHLSDKTKQMTIIDCKEIDEHNHIYQYLQETCHFKGYGFSTKLFPLGSSII